MSVSRKSFPKKQVSNYQSVRSQIRSGDVLLCSGSGWFSKMIQRATDSVWSHVAFVMRLEAIDRVMVLESVESLGVRTVPLSKYLHDYDSQGNPYKGGFVILRHANFDRIATQARLRKFGQFAVQLFGYPYDKHEIAKIAARIAASYLPFTKKEKAELQRDTEYICSEYVWECYRSIGIDIPYDKRGFVAPADFAKAADMKLQFVLQKK